MIIKTPFDYTPANNPVVFTLSGTQQDMVLFKVELLESTTNSTIYTGNIFPTPINPVKASINLSKQLSSVVKYDVDNSNVIALGKPNPMIGYKLKATEYTVTGGTLAPVSSGFTSNTFYAFDGDIDILNYNNFYTNNSHVMKSGNVGRFLTLQPNNKSVNDYSSEQLYFINDGYTALTASFNIGGVDYNFPITAGTTPHYAITAATPEVRAKARITISSGTTTTGDNIGVYGNGNLLGSYTIPTGSILKSQIATNLATSLSGNSYGYGVGVTNTSIDLIAPAGIGTSGNSITLTTGLINSGFTAVTITSSTVATVVFSGYTLPTYPSTTYISVNDPVYGDITICAYDVRTGDTILNAYTLGLVNAINSDTFGYGFAATRNSLNRFTLSARTGQEVAMNSHEADYYNTDEGSLIVNYFSGGTALGTGITTTNYNLIAHTKTAFTGGTTGISAATATTYTSDLENMIRLQTSPKTLAASGVTHSFAEGEPYTVVLKDNSGNTLSEVRKYIYNDLECNLEAVNVLWVNSFGGVDSYQFINPQTSLNVTKLNVKKDNLKLDNANIYSSNGVYNVSDETYNTSTKTSIKVYTKPLTDAESDWLVDLIKSRQCFIELSNNMLLPVQLTTTNYNIQKKKYLERQLNQFQFTFELSDNYLPALSQNVGIIINQ